MWIAILLVLIETAMFKSGFHMKLLDEFKFMLLFGFIYMVLNLVVVLSASAAPRGSLRGGRSTRGVADLF